jgi:LEA14-like dessication related protein
MRRRELLRTGALTLVAIPLSGCASLIDLIRKGIRDPVVRITSMKLDDINLDRVTMIFNTEVENPNPIGFSLAGLSYGLAVEGDRLAKGNVDKKLKLKAKGTSKMSFPVEFDLGKTSRAILKLLELDEAAYGIDTKWKFAWKGAQGIKGGTVTIPVAFDGMFPVPKLPLVEVKDFRFTSITPGGLGMRVTSAVKNPNRFTLPIDDFNFKVKLNGNTVLKNELVDGLSIRSGKTKNVTVDFTVGLVEAGLTLASLVSKPTLKWEVTTKLMAGKVTAQFMAKGKIKLA